jgi:hydrophobic/amphiphilic exporter-1 (mainly G- bacteria), HAE1 family
MKITQAAIRRPVTTMMVFVCFVVLGGISIRSIPLEFFPDISFPFMFVDMPYPGSSPEETERLIAKPAEEALATLTGVREMTTFTSERGVQLQLRFEWGTDIQKKGLQVQEKLDGVRGTFPEDFDRFNVFKASTTGEPMLVLRISSNRDLSGSYDLLERNLKRRLEGVEGVAEARLYGVDRLEILINVKPERLMAYGLDVNQLVSELRAASFSASAGRITDGNQRMVLRPIGEWRSVEEISDIPLANGRIKLSDVADVTMGSPKVDHGRRLDRKPAIGLDIIKESGANTVEVQRAVNEAVAEVSTLPDMQGIQIMTMFDQGSGIISSLRELLKSGLIGALLSFVMLFYFLRNMANTLVVALAVPISLLITIGFMYMGGYSLNILSMMGLMLAVGMLVDNAVVVTESIHRHRLNGMAPYEATIAGVKEVGLAVIAGSMTSIIVFMPNIVSAADEVGLFLSHVAIAITVAMLTSLTLSLTVVPMLYAKLQGQKEPKESKMIARMTQLYSTSLRAILNRPVWTTVGILLILASVAIPISFVKISMNDDGGERRELRMFLNLNGTYQLEEVRSAVAFYEDYLYEIKDSLEIESVYSFFTPNFAQITITLDEDGTMPVDKIRTKIRDNMPMHAICSPAFDFRRSASGENLVRVMLYGESTEELVELSQQLASVMARVPGFKDVKSDAEQGSQEMQIRINPDRALVQNVTANQLADAVGTAIRGTNLRRMRTANGEVDVRVSFDEENRQRIEHLQQVPIGKTTLAQVADIDVRRTPPTIFRFNRSTSMGINMNLEDGLTVQEAGTRISQVMSGIELPAGVRWSLGQSFERDQDQMNTMLINMLLALALIYLVMASLFESLIFPSAIMTTILFSIVGVFWFFLVTGTTFSLMAMIGILILMGVVVNNGIVLIDHIRQLREKGLERKDAVVQAGTDRFRPILMTAGTTILGLLPLCFGSARIGGDGPSYFPMARAIVGGLAFSTIITMLVLPSIYLALDSLRTWTANVLQFATAGKVEKNVENLSI